ncbi:MAG: hypothetical protein WCI27_08605, partial [Candidatus Omnitrophota bacterium]
DPLLIKWDSSNPKDIFAVYTHYIDRVDIEEGVLYPHDITGIKGIGFHHNQVYFMTGDNHFLKYGRDKLKMEPFLDETHFNPSITGINTFYQITAFEENLLFLHGENGSLLFNFPPYQILDKGVAGIQFHDRTKMLMYWTSAAVMLLDTTSDFLPGIKSFHPRVAFPTGEDIQQCFWGNIATHIICNDNDKVYFIEVEPEGGKHHEFITNIRKGSAIYYNHETSILYFLNERGIFHKIQVVPEQGMVDYFLSQRS